MDPRRLLLYYLVMTLFLLVLAAGAYTGLREVSAEAEAVERRLHLVVLVDPVGVELADLALVPVSERAAVEGKWAPALREKVARLREGTAGGPAEARGRNLAAAAEAVLAAPGDDAVLREALAAVRIVRGDVVEDARQQLRDSADHPAAERARQILHGSIAAALLGSLVFTALFLRVLRERRAAEERVRRAEVLAALGTLAAGVAHEANNPLGTIAACADAAGARLRAAPPDLERAASLLGTIGAEARRCSRLVQDLVDFVRDGKPALGPVDLPALVRETVDLARLNPRLKRVPVDVTEAGEVPLLLADAPRLKQAILNLVANAVEVSPEGARVEVAVRGEEGGAAVTVRDRGPGVPPAERRRIFEPFRSGSPGGTGLGLTIVERVAAAHGGTVEVGDAEGGGALFRLRIPARTAAAPVPSETTRPAAGARA